MRQQPARAPIRLTRAQVREIDRRSIEQYHIPGVVLMENAARAVTDVALDMLRNVDNRGVLIVCGGGNNGGDGLAVARHLHNHGVAVRIALAVNPETYQNEAKTNWAIVQAMAIAHVPIADAPLSRGSIGLVIDALFGTGLTTAPRDPNPRWIDCINEANAPVLAVDIPSGLDCDTGVPLGPSCVRATRTVTFVAEKAGFANPLSRQYLGEVTVGHIGCPRGFIDAVASASLAT
jgi:NAD(P)H-hydrate epimerase